MNAKNAQKRDDAWRYQKTWSGNDSPSLRNTATWTNAGCMQNKITFINRVFKPKNMLPLLASLILVFSLTGSLFAQDNNTTGVQSSELHDYHGHVYNTLGKPMEGVSLKPTGGVAGTLTGADGSFNLRAKSGDTLYVSYVGYIEQRLALGATQNLEIQLIESADSSLNDVIVIGYGNKKKSDVTSAIATVNSKDLENTHNGSTVSAMLAGKLPGVSFRMSDSRPGASASVSIRNMGSALFIIDGIPQDEGQFNNISPNDIESISVLKDASAAIYGVEAANGVVLVTTKRGKLGGANRINLNAYTGWQNWTRFPKTVNNYDWQKGKVEADVNQGKTPISQEELDKYQQGTEDGYKNFDWYDFIVQPNSPLNNVNLNFTGGSDKINYYVSASNLFQNSVLGREYKFNRTNIQSNIDAQVTKRLKIGASINGRIEDRQNPGVPGTDDYWEARFAILRNTPWERPFANDNPDYLNDIGHNTENWGLLNTKLSGKYQDTWRILQTNLNAEYKTPIEGLVLKGLFGYYYANELLNNHEYTYDAYTFDPKDSTYNVTGGSSNPWRERRQRMITSTDVQLQADYAHTFGKHSIGVTFVTERNKRRDLNNWVHAVPTTNVLPLIYFSTMDTYDDGDITTSKIGYVGRISYNYNNKYYLEVAGRRDASYILSPEHKWGTFPFASGGWRITQEPFFQRLISPDILNELKLRGSYGLTGDDRNLPIDEFSYLEAYDYNDGNPAILDGNAVISSKYRGLPVTTITWIKSHMLDLGLDFGLFHNKLTGSFDYFKRVRSDIPGTKYDVLLPSELGYTLPEENLPDNKDKVEGLEGAINYHGQAGKVNFSIGANLSYARTYTVSTYKPRFFNSLDQYYNSQEGRPQNLDWGYTVIGQFTSQDQINNYPVNIDGQGNSTLLPGDLIYKDFNNDGVINKEDTRPLGWGGGRNPIFNGGLNLAASWNGFDFHMDFSMGAGYSFVRDYEMRWPYQNGGALQEVFYDSHWHHEDIYDVNSPWVAGDYPAMRFNESGQSNYNKPSSFWLTNIKYIRCRTLELGYSLPSELLERLKISKARFYVNANNLFSIDNVHQYGIDAEIYDNNGLTYPQSKYLNVGINLSF